MKSPSLLSAAVAAVLALGSAVNALAFTCKISPDKKTATMIGSNTQAKETSCTVHCDILTSRGSTAILECMRTLAANTTDHEFCTRSNESGATFEKLLEAYGSCVDQSAVKQDDDDDDDVDVQKLADPKALKEKIGKDLPPAARKMLDGMK